MLLRERRMTRELIRMLDGWRHSGFNVFAGRRIQPREKSSLENLAAYLIRATFSAEASKIEPLLTFIEYRTSSDPFDSQSLKTLQSLDEIHRKRPGGCDFDQGERTFFPDEQVDLVAVGVTEEVYLRPDPLAECAFHNIRYDEVLIEITAQGAPFLLCSY